MEKLLKLNTLKMEKLLKIPYAVFNDWDQLQQFLERRGNPRYELVGDVDLSYKKDIFDLGNLVRVDGDFIAYRSSIQSLGNLQYVSGALNLYKSSIQSLGSLEYVGGYLDLKSTPIESLGNLQYVGGYLDLVATPIESLGNLEHVGGEIILSRNQIPEEQLTKFKIYYW